MTKFILAFSLLISVSPVLAGIMTFNVPDLDVQKFYADYKIETGLPALQMECSTCTVSGNLNYDEGILTVYIYEALDPDHVWITSTTLTGDVTGQITVAVDNN